MLSYSLNNDLYLNKKKTQLTYFGNYEESIHITEEDPINPSKEVEILGMTLDKKANYTVDHKKTREELKRRNFNLRRLTTQLPRGKMLNQVANALVLGRAQVNSWITHSIQTTSRRQAPDDTQILLNNTTRILCGKRLEDRERVERLTDRTNFRTMNEMAIRGASVAAWRAVHGSPLEDLLTKKNSISRAYNRNLRTAQNQSTAALNMEKAWNSNEKLRNAKSIGEAKSAAKKFAKECRFY